MSSLRTISARMAICLSVLTLTFLVSLSNAGARQPDRIGELDKYWAASAATVAAGDIKAYRKTFHKDAVVVSEISGSCYPIAQAFERWQAGFEDTKKGKIKAKVEFRFSKRIGDETTAHESGIFHYSTATQTGKTTSAYIYFDALLVKKDGRWLAMMEMHKSKATEEQWAELSKTDR